MGDSFTGAVAGSFGLDGFSRALLRSCVAMALPELPTTDELGAVVMRALERRAVRTDLAELRESVRVSVSYGLETGKAWEREFLNVFRWAMLMLSSLGEVRRWLPSPEFPTGSYEVVQGDSDARHSERARRRREWVEQWRKSHD
jgi:hypothetical protein